MNAKLNGSRSPSDEIDIQGDNSHGYRGVKNQTHAGVDRAQTDQTKMSNKMTLGLFAYNIRVLEFGSGSCRWFLDPDVVHAVMVLQKFQHDGFVPLNLATVRYAISTFLAQVFGWKLNLWVLRIFAAISSQPFVDFVVASPKPEDRFVVGTDFVFEIRGHLGEVFLAFLAAEEVAEEFPDACKNI